LDHLGRRGIVVANRRAGPGAYRFRHLLIRDVAYASLPKAERARLHEAFGLELEAEATAGGRREELVEILAYHAERALFLSLELRMPALAVAARARRAFDLALDAAERAVDREDRRASEAFLAMLEGAAAALGDGLDAADRAGRLLLVGRVEELRPNYDAAEAALAEAIVAAESIDRHDLAGEAHLWLARSLIQSLRDEGDRAQIAESTAAARRHFAAIGDADGQIAAETVDLEWLFSFGRLSEMIERGQALAALAVSIGVPGRAAQLYARLVSTAGWLGRSDLAEAFYEHAMALSAELGLASTSRWARFYRARLSWMRGELDEAERACRALAEDGDSAGDGTMSLVARRLLSETLLETDRLGEAGAAVEDALEWSVRTGDRWSRTELLAMRGLVRLRHGDLAAAQALLAESQATFREGDVAAQCVLLDLRGLIARAAGDPASAEQAFREEVRLARATEYWWWTQGALELTELLVAEGRPAEAAPLITEVDETMRRMGYGLRRARIEAVLAAVAAVSAAPQAAGRAPGTSSGI
jgi:tetratricopeptide (TPR) repeat protein